jgi:hypothetical protein
MIGVNLNGSSNISMAPATSNFPSQQKHFPFLNGMSMLPIKHTKTAKDTLTLYLLLVKVPPPAHQTNTNYQPKAPQKARLSDYMTKQVASSGHKISLKPKVTPSNPTLYAKTT